jgi:hypothetical protein
MTQQENPPGPGDLAVELVAVDEIKYPRRNARRHRPADLAELASSLSRFKQRKAVVIARDGTVVAGEGTVRAARQLGWTHVWAARWDAPEAEARAYALADNRTAELSAFDYAALSAEIQDLSALGAPVEGLGWDGPELDALLGARWQPPAPPATPAPAAPGGTSRPAPMLDAPRLPDSASLAPTPSAPTIGSAPSPASPAWPAPSPAPEPAPVATPPAQPRWVCFSAEQWATISPLVTEECGATLVPEAEAIARLLVRAARGRAT